MSTGTVADLRVVLHEDPSGRLADDRRHELLSTLLEAGHAVTRTLGAAAQRAERTRPLVRFATGTAPGEGGGEFGGEVIVLDGMGAAEARQRVEALREERALAGPGGWTPWFPVIDYERCTNCMQCLSFCLFDVYGVDKDGKIEVRNEDKCKTNCPACSRVCPDVAILFPKYKKGPINGDVVRQEDVESESMKVDITALLGGDIYSALRDRHDTARRRFSTERDESKALLERRRCLKELGEAFDVPPEVLMSLPSAGEIEERARRAREKMERRRKASRTVQDGERATTDREWGI